MELRHLRYFVAVAEELHFRRAAERLHMSQPPLSQQIRALEDELGVTLLERSQRRVTLTAAGAAFYERAREILAAVEDASRLVKRVNRGEVGRLAVGFVGSAMYSLVPEVLGAFASRYADVDLHLRELTTSAQLRQLESGQIDVGFIRPASERPGLAFETVEREPVVVALPVSHPLAQEPSLDLARLAGETLVLLGRDESPGVRGSLAGATDLVRGDVQEVREMQTVIALVRAGVGISLVPESLRALAREGVVYRELPPGGPTVELAMAWRSEDRSPVLAAFKEVARERVAAAVAARRPPPGGERRRGPAPQ
jgi:DNA-binding transcriptional LysR family regulator